MRVAGVDDIMLPRQRGKGQETAARPHKREQQPGGGDRIVSRSGQREAKRYQRVKQEVEGDIKKSSRVRQATATRQRTVQTIQQPVQHNGDQRWQIPAQRQKR